MRRATSPLICVTVHGPASVCKYVASWLFPCVAALLIAGRIRIRVASQWIKVSGDKAIEGLKNNNAFGKVDVATNDDTVDQATLLRAATRLLSVTGQNILPMPQNVSRGVQEHFPKFQRDYASLAAELL